MKVRWKRLSGASLYPFCTTALVLAFCFVWFSIRASHAWIASGFTDPVGHSGAQDESVYSRVVLEMADHGKWLVPMFLGRLAYFKPPLLYWLSAAAVKLLGISAYTLRLPSVLAGTGTCAVAWSWVRRERGTWPAFLTVLLIATDHYWIMMSSLNMTDAPLVFFSLAAIWIVSRDITVERKATLWFGALCIAAAILTKSAAAVVPALTLAACAKTHRVWALLGLAVALASPWFVYTILTHGQWFWNEHVLTELLGNGVGATPLATQDSNQGFYLSRLFLGDPVVAWAGIVALIIAAWKRTGHKPVIVWLSCNCLALLLFRYHAAPYLLPVVTALALTAGFALPSIPSRWQGLLVCVPALASGLFLFTGQSIIWKGTNVPSTRALEVYCESGRDNGLFILQPDDEYFSAILPLRNVAYGVIDHGVPAKRQPIDWRFLGVTVTAEEFDDQAKLWPIFSARLAGMGLYLNANASRDPRGTGILIRDEAAALGLVRKHSELDFFVPKAFAARPGEHEIGAGTADQVFLLSKTVRRHRGERPGWSCRVGL